MDRGRFTMKTVFFGTPDYVLPVLDALKNAGYKIAAVVTQPPKPVGRKKVLTLSPVTKWAKQNEIPVIEGSPKAIYPLLSTLHPHPRLGILAAYGRIIPEEIIKFFPLGILNIHPSLLPKYRGASPVEAAIVAGEKQTGVTIIKLDKELDHGPIVSQLSEPILEDDTKTSLRQRLFEKGAEVLVQILPAYLEGRIELREQDHDKATFTTLLKKEHGFIPPKYLELASKGETFQAQWEIPFIKNYSLVPSAQNLERFIRAFNPWPGAYTKLKIKDEKLKILKLLKAHVEQRPGTQESRNLVTYLILDLVQLEGKNPVTWRQFKLGYPDF